MDPVKDDFTGFIAHYNNDKLVYEKESYYSTKARKKCATNWSEIDKNKLVSLELLWHGQSKARVDKKQNIPGGTSIDLNPADWFFSQTGYLDLSTRKIQVLSRNIGYKRNGIIYITTVMEQTGIIRIHTRAQ